MPHGCAPAWRGALLALALLAAAPARPASAETPVVLAPYQGSALAPFSLAHLDGGTIGSADRLDEVVVIHFFATWCEPCRPEMASLERLRVARGARGLAILALSVAEPESRLQRFFAASPVGFPILLDADRAVSRRWGVHALPSTVVLDRRGRARLAVRGDLDWERPDVLAALDRLLAEDGAQAGAGKTDTNTEGATP